MTEVVEEVDDEVGNKYLKRNMKPIYYNYQVERL